MPKRPKTHKPMPRIAPRHGGNDKAGQYSKLYTTSRWRKARQRFLDHHPVCAMCQQAGFVSVATVVDHIVPHRGDMTLFWDESNWQPLCKQCHDSRKQSEEKSGKPVRVIGLDGLPINTGGEAT